MLFRARSINDAEKYSGQRGGRARTLFFYSFCSRFGPGHRSSRRRTIVRIPPVRTRARVGNPEGRAKLRTNPVRRMCVRFFRKVPKLFEDMYGGYRLQEA